METYQVSTQVLGNYVQGRFEVPFECQGEIIARSPADLSLEVGRFKYSYADVDRAVESAQGALSSWRKLSFNERAEYLKRYQSILKKREREWIEVISKEVGKPIWEAKTEIAAMINKVEITLHESMKLVSNFEIPKIMEGTVGVCRYRPLGVMAVIGPFNFPGHLPNGHVIPALATGNTVVFKPSEKTPAAGQLIAECFHEAGLPAGVFNLIHGEKEVGRRLCVHEQVAGVLFTGSYDVGLQIKQDTLKQHWKLLALEMGGKNPMIVWKDARIDFAVHEALQGAFLTAGQRCSATSRVLVHRSVFRPFLEKLHERAKAFAIGHPLDQPFMGPLIDQTSVDRYLKFMGIAQREGFELIMRGKALELPHRGHYVTPTLCALEQSSLDQTLKSVYQQTELFAPNLAVVAVDELEEAVTLSNATQFGLVASVMTQDRIVYEYALENLEMGLVNWNKTTVGASSKLPFGGFKKSGNHFPTALSSTLYCSAPVASLEVSETPALDGLVSKSMGLNWN